MQGNNPVSYQEKQEQAKELIAQAKAAVASGEANESAENAAKFAAQVKDAQRIMAEVKAERTAEENQKLAALLEEADKAGETADPQRAVVKSAPKSVEPESPYGEGFRVKDRMTMRVKADSEAGQKMVADLRIKALNEGSGAAGNFLVPPAYMQDLFAETRRQGNALRRYGMLAEHPVESNQVLLPRGSGAATVGIVSENATKPSADQSYTQVTVNIFTGAGISKVSKQLVMDSSPTAADLVARELGTLLGNLEEQKIINGSGSGEPRGILNTTGVNAISATGSTGQSLIDAVLDGVVAIQTTYFAPPTGLLMHPRRWAFLAKSKDTANNYIFNNPGVFRAPASWPDGVTSQSTGGSQSMPSLLGLPIAISANIPINLGTETDEDAIILADWGQAHWFQRQDVTMDVSDVAGTAFESNQVWYRLEERFGFSAERYPAAFAVITGDNLSTTGS
jgi:HK97 family phage major capsid protein